LKVIGLFAGIGGLELGLKAAGHTVEAVVENDLVANRILAQRFPDVVNLGDVMEIRRLPESDLIACGFPCQDLSPAGEMGGIHGPKSRLVSEALRLIHVSRKKPKWLLFENVPFMLSLNRGAAMRFLTRRLEEEGYRWAYRVVDSRAFGLAQRRRRVFLLGSRCADPAEVLFVDQGASREPVRSPATPCGFYWTEGNKGVGWAVDATPPLKGTSGVGIASPPAVWRPETRDFVTPTIEDAEALQGFRRGWTKYAKELPGGERARWRLVGNAVSVPAAAWVGRLLHGSGAGRRPPAAPFPDGHAWPRAAYGGRAKRYKVEVSEWPGKKDYVGLSAFLSPCAPHLSLRAAKGFRSRLERSGLRVPVEFVEDLERFVATKEAAGAGPQDQHTDGSNAGPRQLPRKGASVGALC
jgi:DNA (cytosine-5)-methyltransferase 1